MTKTHATLIGSIAILLWALLAFFTATSGAIPPFQLTAFCFAIATMIGFVALVKSGKGLEPLNQPIKIWLLGVGGLFGYHIFYFTALQNAPPVETGLIAYLWPLLIILFSALLPEEELKPHHILGGLLGLTGAFLIVAKAGFEFQSQYALGYAAAGACALIWSGYSVLSRRFSNVPSEAVTGFCAASAGLALLAHWAWESTVWPQETNQWLAMVALGVGPVGGAFYVWDVGVKRGSIQVLGAASYAAPVLSTLVLIAAGYGTLTWRIALATLLVTLGALVAAKDLLRG